MTVTEAHVHVGAVSREVVLMHGERYLMRLSASQALALAERLRAAAAEAFATFPEGCEGTAAHEFWTNNYRRVGT